MPKFKALIKNINSKTDAGGDKVYRVTFEPCYMEPEDFMELDKMTAVDFVLDVDVKSPLKK